MDTEGMYGQSIIEVVEWYKIAGAKQLHTTRINYQHVMVLYIERNVC